MAAARGILIGAGDRGAHAYAPHLLRHPAEGRFVAVAEPRRERREAFGSRYGVPEAARFADHRALFAAAPEADFVLVATADALHVEPALSALRLGYHVLLEKPMALSREDCLALVSAAEHSGRILQVCHVMRYAPLFSSLAQIVRSGELGRIVTIQHSENVSFWHYAHSYCRGHWRNVAESSPMILAKSCHDLDMLYWLAGDEPEQLVSLARPTELCEANKPEGAPLHCIEGCPHSARCPYDAVEMYLDVDPLARDLAKTERPAASARLLRGLLGLRALAARAPLESLRERVRWTRWPVSTISDDATPAGIERALRTTRWGRCVYQVGDNDQVASQSVAVLFRNGVNASFTMHGHSYREGRETRIDGMLGSAVARFYLLEQSLELSDHKSGRKRSVRFPLSFETHGGGDSRLFADFLAALRGECEPLTTARESLQSHLMAFAAERSRSEGRVVHFASETP